MSDILFNSCRTCRHFRPVGEELCCTRYPPAVSFLPQQISPNEANVVKFAGFPIVKEDWTCGEHVGKLSS